MPTTKTPARKPGRKTKKPAKTKANNSAHRYNELTVVPELPADPGTMSFAQLDEVVRKGSLVFAAVGRALAETKMTAAKARVSKALELDSVEKEANGKPPIFPPQSAA